MKITTASNISLGFWNIDGLHYIVNGKRLSKLDDKETLQKLIQHDIICMVETHCNQNDIIDLEDYSIVMNIRPKSPKATKHSSGIAICVRKTIKAGITFLPITNTEFMWIKLNKTFFNMPENVFIAVVYKCPENSSYASKTGDIFELLEIDIAKYSQEGTCLLCGDFNGRTGTLPDYCIADNIDKHIDLPYSYVQDTELPRNNSDKQGERERVC
jgi:exonuclease III